MSMANECTYKHTGYVWTVDCNYFKPFFGRFFFFDGSEDEDAGGGVTAGEYVAGAAAEGTASELEVEVEACVDPPHAGAEPTLPIRLRN